MKQAQFLYSWLSAIRIMKVAFYLHRVLQKGWDMAWKSRSSIGLMISLFGQTDCEPVLHYMLGESNLPWQYPQPRYRQSLLHPQFQPLSKTKSLVIPTDFFIPHLYELTFASFLPVLRDKFWYWIPNLWSDTPPSAQYRPQSSPVPTCLHSIGLTAIMLRFIPPTSRGLPCLQTSHPQTTNGPIYHG